MPAPRKYLLVLFWMIGSLVSFAGVALSVRGLQGAMTVFEMLAIRNIGGLIILGGMMLLAPGPDQTMRMVRPGIHLLRNVGHFAGQALWVWGVMVLPLATVFAIEFTHPCWVELFAVLFLKERMNVSRALAIALGFVGVLIILRPGLDSFRPEALAVVLAAVFSAADHHDEVPNGLELDLDHHVLDEPDAAAMNMVANMLLGQPPWIVGKLSTAIWLPVHRHCGDRFLAHYCLTNAFRHGDATLVVPIDSCAFR